MTEPSAPRVRLLPATVAHLDALSESPDALARLLGTPVPAGWPEFPEAIGFTRDRLAEHPEEAEWWMQLFLDADSGALVGSGGFVGPPADGVVEIGYEIAPAFRGRGYGTAAAGALAAEAARRAGVTELRAHTLATPNASTAVLARLGFRRDAEELPSDDGPLWRWRRAAD